MEINVIAIILCRQIYAKIFSLFFLSDIFLKILVHTVPAFSVKKIGQDLFPPYFNQIGLFYLLIKFPLY